MSHYAPAKVFQSPRVDEYVRDYEIEVEAVLPQVESLRKQKMQRLLDFRFNLAVRFSKREGSIVPFGIIERLFQRNIWDEDGIITEANLTQILNHCQLNRRQADYIRLILGTNDLPGPVRCRLCGNDSHIAMYCNLMDFRQIIRNMSPADASGTITAYLTKFGGNPRDETARANARETLRIGQLMHRKL